MFLYQAKLGIRNLKNQRFYSFTSILGLSVSICVCLFVWNFVRYELNHETMHPDNDRIVRLNWLNSGTGSVFATFQNPLSPLIARNIPEVLASTRLFNREFLLGLEDRNYHSIISLVDANFFEVFHYDAVAGNPSVVIGDPNGAVVTQSGAIQLFGTVDAVGEMFSIRGKSFQVRAIVADTPPNTHLVTNFFVNIENSPELLNIPNLWNELYRSAVMFHYLKLSEGANLDALEDKILNFIKTSVVEEYNYEVILQPLTDIHFSTDLQREIADIDDVTGISKPRRPEGDLFIFGAAAILTLSIAIFNFINLQAVQASKKVKIIGLKRILGGSTSEIGTQYIFEAVVICYLAMMAAVALFKIGTPFFSATVDVPIQIFSITQIPTLILIWVSPLLLGILAGLYPAWIINRANPGLALKGDVSKLLGHAKFRSALVVMQFSVSCGMIIAASTVSKQLEFSLSKPLGYDPEGVVIVQMSNSMRNFYGAIRNQLLEDPNVLEVAISSLVPTQDSNSGGFFRRVGASGDEDYPTRNITMSGIEYFDALGMEIVAGRSLNFDYRTDQQLQIQAPAPERRGGVMLNETAARSMGWNDPADAIGEQLIGNMPYGRYEATVVGVVADAHFRSVRTDIEPMAFLLNRPPFNMIIKTSGEEMPRAIELIETVWQQHVPELPLRLSFLEESYSGFYANETRTLTLFLSLSAIAVLVSCLGLYALSSFIAHKRTKEMSIRKALGASTGWLVNSLIWDFIKVVLLAILIAWPVAWFVMQNWLNNFAYRIDIGVLIFLASGALTAFFAVITVFETTYKTASRNPIESLQIE